MKTGIEHLKPTYKELSTLPANSPAGSFVSLREPSAVVRNMSFVPQHVKAWIDDLRLHAMVLFSLIGWSLQVPARILLDFQVQPWNESALAASRPPRRSL
jgi:hypothetical protein